jgi:hypothetical protein
VLVSEDGAGEADERQLLQAKWSGVARDKVRERLLEGSTTWQQCT